MKGKESSLKTFSYFDIEANGFRSFRINNLITIY
ncbi:MAG: SH3 beta-barrel fold-containing protein [Dysgonomonas sp.]